ncbi:hypothetical protein Tco_1165155 [Tanacetum coccineum]
MSSNQVPLMLTSSRISKSKEGGSILEILEEMITVGQTMGFSMEGCVKDMEKIIGTQGELDLPGFDEMISSSWASFNLDDSNAMIRFKKKLKLLKVEIHGIGLVDPLLVKKNFVIICPDNKSDPGPRKETKFECAVLGGVVLDKIPRETGVLLRFFRKYWTVVGTDFCSAVLWFFDHGEFAIGCYQDFASLGSLITDISDLNYDVQAIILLDGILEVEVLLLCLGPQWCSSWIRGKLKVSFHLSYQSSVEACTFKGEWSQDNLKDNSMLLSQLLFVSPRAREGRGPVSSAALAAYESS